jgi:hypothetical protein
MERQMATVGTGTVIRELELSVKYFAEPAEKDVGHPNSVEILSVSINGVSIPLTKEQEDAIRDEIIENHYYAH